MRVPGLVHEPPHRQSMRVQRIHSRSPSCHMLCRARSGPLFRRAVWAASCWVMACPQVQSVEVTAFMARAPSIVLQGTRAGRAGDALTCRREGVGRVRVRMAAGGSSELDKLNELKAQLERAVAQEQYAEAARLRDEIQAKSRFLYAAFRV